MIRWAILFLLIALIAGAFGFGLVAGIAWDAAKLLCIVFLVLFVVSFVFGSRPPRDAL
jgi:uncharacterized membrane protein YtjA (UPF0391 family)